MTARTRQHGRPTSRDTPAPPSASGSGTAGKPASPWSGRRRPRDHEIKREAVIRAAARAFDARGYHHTSLDDIAEDLGVSKPTVYYYVENKEQLLYECFLAGLHPIREAFGAASRTGGTGRERLVAVIRGYALAIASEYGWCMVRAHDQDLRPAMRRQINALKSEIDLGIRGLLQAGMADGSIGGCDPKIAAFALAGALNWIAHWYRADEPMSAEQVADAFVAVFEQGLLPRANVVAGRTGELR
jgi:AcrR family transcriptional regulator